MDEEPGPSCDPPHDAKSRQPGCHRQCSHHAQRSHHCLRDLRSGELLCQFTQHVVMRIAQQPEVVVAGHPRRSHSRTFRLPQVLQEPTEVQREGCLRSVVQDLLGSQGSGGLRRRSLNDPKVAWSPGTTSSSYARRAKLATATARETSRLAEIKAIQTLGKLDEPFTKFALWHQALLPRLHQQHPKNHEEQLPPADPRCWCGVPRELLPRRTADTYVPSKNFGGGCVRFVDIILTDQCVAKGSDTLNSANWVPRPGLPPPNRDPLNR